MKQRKETKHFLREGGYSEKHSQKSWILNFDGVFARQAKDGETFPAVALAVGAVRAKLTLNVCRKSCKSVQDHERWTSSSRSVCMSQLCHVVAVGL